MRKIFVFALIGLLAGVGVVGLIEIDPGYVLVAYGNYTLETSLWVGGVCLLIFTGLAYLLLRFIRKILGGKNALSGWWGARRSRQGVHLTNHGLISFIEGNWSKSRRQLLQGAKGNEAPLINYLVAARASNQLDEPDKMREYLGAAEASEADAGIAVELSQAEMKLARGQYEQALATLVRARRNAGRNPSVLKLLCKVYEGLKDWSSLQELIPELRKYKVVSEEGLVELEQRAYNRQFMVELASSDVDTLHRAWQHLPASLKKDRTMTAKYVAALIKAQAHDESEKLILRAVKKQWDSALVRLYGFVHAGNSAKQLAQAEAWLDGHSDDTQLQLCLGRLACREKLWGKARDYFENSYKLEHNSEVCAELGRLLDKLGEPKVSAAYYREGLMLCESSLPELPMPDKAITRARRLAGS
ncbi:MAG: heme biosynthesis protein HemY [Halioglobus sp.]